MPKVSAILTAGFFVLFVLSLPGFVLAAQLKTSPPAGSRFLDMDESARSDDIVIFGGDSSYFPFEWLDDSGEMKGFITDIEKAMAKRRGKRPVHATGAWPEVVSALDSGAVDVVPMFISPKRQARYIFSQPFFYFKHAIYSNSDRHDLMSLNDLKGLRVAVEGRSFAEERLQTDYPDVTLIRANDSFESLLAVTSHRADAAIIAVPVASKLIRMHDLQLQRYGLPFWSEGYAFAVRNDRTDLADWVARSLDGVLKSGDYDDIFGQWQDELEAYPVSIADGMGLNPMYFALGAGALLLLSAGIFGWHYRVAGSGENTDLGPMTEQLLAHHDAETGLPGVDLFSRQVEDILNRKDRDRDRWKYAVFRLCAFDSIVRAHGVRVAVALVSELANRLRGREYRLVGYFGRGYFGVLAERPLFGLGPHVLLDPVEVPTEDAISAVMCGVTKVPPDSRHLEDFAHFAETALSQCAVRHRNWLLYEDTMQADPVDPRIVRAFRQGETEGLSVVYQPQMDVASGLIVGMESLIRWQHPGLGNVPPGKFIPLLEQAGLVGQVTDFMLSSSAVMCARMAMEKRAVSVSVNLSVHDLMDQGTYDKIAACLDWSNCPASQFVVELTETAFAEDPQLVRSTLMRLRGLGVKISIDDFGTGFASLSYLSEFPADEVKIDRLFVSRMRRSARDRAIIRSTIRLAQDIGLVVVAEGVEDMETLAMLKEEGCDRVQGFGIARPVEEKNLDHYLGKRMVDA